MLEQRLVFVGREHQAVEKAIDEQETRLGSQRAREAKELEKAAKKRR